MNMAWLLSVEIMTQIQPLGCWRGHSPPDTMCPNINSWPCPLLQHLAPLPSLFQKLNLEVYPTSCNSKRLEKLATIPYSPPPSLYYTLWSETPHSQLTAFLYFSLPRFLYNMQRSETPSSALPITAPIPNTRLVTRLLYSKSLCSPLATPVFLLWLRGTF